MFRLGPAIVLAIALIGCSGPSPAKVVITSSASHTAITLPTLAPPLATHKPKPIVVPPSPSRAPTITSTPTRAPVPAPVHVPTMALLYGVSFQQVLINADRGGNRLAWSACLAAVAQQSAQRMAAAGVISHGSGIYQDLACHLGHTTGENVGFLEWGIADAILNALFMASPEHRANILGPYHWVGTAWATGANGAGYIAVEFG